MRQKISTIRDIYNHLVRFMKCQGATKNEMERALCYYTDCKNSWEKYGIKELEDKYCLYYGSYPNYSKDIAPKKIIHSDLVTVVFWNDNTKTVVRLSPDDTYDEYAAFCAALAIKTYGSNSALKRIIQKVTK